VPRGTLPTRRAITAPPTSRLGVASRATVSSAASLANPTAKEAAMQHYGTHLRQAFCDWIDEGMPDLAACEEA
jgi:hypothetical protein